MKDNMLEVGDKLYFVERYSNNKRYAGAVDRISKTMAFIGKTKISRDYHDGAWSVGGTVWDRVVYRLADEKTMDEIQSKAKHSKLVYRCSKIDFAKLSDDTLYSILILASR